MLSDYFGFYRYFLHFDARKGTRFMSDIAIDDVSLSPECFGLNIPESELNGYNYWNPVEEPSSEVHTDFANQSGNNKMSTYCFNIIVDEYEHFDIKKYKKYADLEFHVFISF